MSIPTTTNNPYLTPEEIDTLMAMGEYKSPYEQNADAKNMEDLKTLEKMGVDAYNMNKPTTGVYAPSSLPQKTGQSGGFAIAPLIPLIAGVVPSLINGIKSLFSGREQQQGQGIEAVNEFFNTNMDELKRIEEDIKKMSVKDAWNTLYKLQKQIMETVLEDIPNVSGNVKTAFVDKMMSKSYPKGFLKIVNREPKEGKGVKFPVSNHGMALPVIKYGVCKMCGNQGQSVYKEVKSALRSGSGIYDGGKLNWAKIKEFAKKGLKFAIPIAQKLIGQAVDSGVAGNTVKSLLNKFNIFENVKPETINSIIGSIVKPSNGGMLHSPTIYDGGRVQMYRGDISKFNNGGMLNPSTGGSKKKKNYLIVV